MKTTLVLLLSGLLLALGQTVRAQTDYVLGAVVIAGGGGETSGGGYTLSTTIGQWDADPMAVDTDAIAGGFWSTEEVSWLRIQRTGNSVLLAWPAAITGSQLQASPAIAGNQAAWGTVAQPATLVNGENQVMIPITPGSRFFRLFKP